MEFSEVAHIQCLVHTHYTISITGDFIISCWKPGKLGHGVAYISLPVPLQLVESMSPRMHVQKEDLGLQEESVMS